MVRRMDGEKRREEEKRGESNKEGEKKKEEEEEEEASQMSGLLIYIVLHTPSHPACHERRAGQFSGFRWKDEEARVLVFSSATSIYIYLHYSITFGGFGSCVSCSA